MRSMRKYLHRVVLAAFALTLCAGLLPIAVQPAGAASLQNLLHHEGGLLLDGEGILLDFSPTATPIDPPKPLHESLASFRAMQPTATVTLGAPALQGSIVLGDIDIGDVVGGIKDGIVDGAGAVDDAISGTPIVGGIYDGAKEVVKGEVKWTIDAAGTVVRVVKNGIDYVVKGGEWLYDEAGHLIGQIKDGIVTVWNIVNPGCNPFDPDTYKQCLKNFIGAATCLVPVAAVITAFVLKDWGCLNYLKRALTQAASWVLNQVLRRLIYQLNEVLRDNVIYMTNYTLIEMLGKNHAGPYNFSAVVDCNLVPGSANAAAVGIVTETSDGTPNGAAATCASTHGNSAGYWFTGQYRLMRMIGLLLVIPLMLMVVLQSIIRGSLFFLLRAFLVMLPIAVLGSVLMFSVAQLLMNVADDMSLYLANQTVSPSEFGTKFNKAVGQLDAKSFGFFTVFWFIMLLLSMSIIWAELMLRQMGIYLTLLFIPIAFATMVYPATVKWLKRAFSLLLGLIFMKLFIIAVLSMGFAAMAQTAQTTGDKGDVDIIINQAILAVIMLLFAGFGGTKILAFTPAADAVANRIANPGEMLGMGDFSAQQLQKYGGQVLDRVGGAAQGSGVGGGVGSADAGVAGAPPAPPQPQNPSGPGDAAQPPPTHEEKKQPSPDGAPKKDDKDGGGPGLADAIKLLSGDDDDSSSGKDDKVSLSKEKSDADSGSTAKDSIKDSIKDQAKEAAKDAVPGALKKGKEAMDKLGLNPLDGINPLPDLGKAWKIAQTAHQTEPNSQIPAHDLSAEPPPLKPMKPPPDEDDDAPPPPNNGA